VNTRIAPAKNKWESITFWRTVHLGKNPIKGGSPPNDSRLEKTSNWLDLEIGRLDVWLRCHKLKLEKIKIKGKSNNK